MASFAAKAGKKPAVPAAPLSDGRFTKLPSYLEGTAYAEILENALASAPDPSTQQQQQLQQQQQSPSDSSFSSFKRDSISQFKQPGYVIQDPLDSTSFIVPSVGSVDVPAETAASVSLHRRFGDADVDRSSSFSARLLESPAPPPLPSCWSPEGSPSSLELSNDKLEIIYKSESSKPTDKDAASMRANHPIPPQCGLYYFEVEIVCGKEGSIGIGFCGPKMPLAKMPGLVQDSWGYHGVDGNTFACQANGMPSYPYGPEFTTNDVIGCAINFRNGSVFYTKNGISLGIAFNDIKESRLYPAVGMRSHGEHIRVNFGQQPFVFDIDAYMIEEKAKTYKQISSYPLPAELVSNATTAASSSSAGGSGASDAALSRLIHKLIASYLGYNGYVESARAFADDVKSESSAFSTALYGRSATAGGAADFQILEDVETVNRQQIRTAVLEGNIDRALKLAEHFFPKVFKEDPKILFQLRCRKFVELMRACALAREKEKEGGVFDEQAAAQSEDQEMADFTTIDSEKSPSSTTAVKNADELLSEALKYGQKLREDYKGVTFPAKSTAAPAPVLSTSSASSSSLSPASSSSTPSPQHPSSTTSSPPVSSVLDAQKALTDIFSLMAYPDPLQSPVAHLLSEHGRAAVAEDLNAAILVSEGKSSVAPLEKLIKHTTVLIHELAEHGGQASFVNIRRDFLSS
ncbi:ran-binding protein [Myxozyma melibiosi]|uniref:Ran-binding protein n=1 Tax=Myxozyma melibiosi TaxID=54550 RepID=A0ABR1F3J4_9ASCO